MSAQVLRQRWWVWVAAVVGRLRVAPGQTAQFELHIRNFLSRPQTHRIAIHTPPGVKAEPGVIDGEAAPGKTAIVMVRLAADPQAKAGTQIVAFDTTIDGQRHGEWFDATLQITEPNTP